MTVLLIIVALVSLNIYDRQKHADELEITRSIEIANWHKLNQLESRINGQDKEIFRNNEKVVDCIKKQIYNPIYIDCEL
jgi:hypothetical protein